MKTKHVHSTQGSSINNVTDLGGWGQGFCDDSTVDVLLKSGVGCKKISKMA